MAICSVKREGGRVRVEEKKGEDGGKGGAKRRVESSRKDKPKKERKLTIPSQTTIPSQMILPSTDLALPSLRVDALRRVLGTFPCEVTFAETDETGSERHRVGFVERRSALGEGVGGGTASRIERRGREVSRKAKRTFEKRSWGILTCSKCSPYPSPSWSSLHQRADLPRERWDSLEPSVLFDDRRSRSFLVLVPTFERADVVPRRLLWRPSLSRA